MNDYEIRVVCGHIEVYQGGIFQFSADTIAEAYREIQWLEEN